MALANYSDLKAAVADYILRSDLTTVIPTFISLAESRLNRLLQLRITETVTTLTGTLGSRELSLPTDYIEAISLDLTTTGDFCRLAAKEIAELGYASSNGTPWSWAVQGAKIILDRPCDQAHTFQFRYRQSFALSDGATTNWLMTSHPDVYLMASLVEAYAYMKAEESAAMWLAKLNTAIEEVMVKEGRSKSRAELSIDAALVSGGSVNYPRSATWPW